jgi:thioester reductase-like protein
VLENTREHAAGWVNGYEQSKAEAERCVRELRDDWVIVRPSTLVCDDESGVVSHQNAVHRALRLMHAGLTSMMPTALGSALDVVTTRYVARATAMLALDAGTTRATYHLCAGEQALPLDEVVDLTFAVWARDAAWRAKGISRPVLTDLDTYTLFARSVEETGDVRLRQTVRSLSHFVPQLALAKRFDTALADRVVGARAPDVRRFWPRMVDSLRRRAALRGEAAA